MQSRLPRDLRVERDDEHVPLADRHGMTVDGGEDLHVLAAHVGPWRADEHRADRLALAHEALALDDHNRTLREPGEPEPAGLAADDANGRELRSTPLVDVAHAEPAAIVEHEATTSKISEDQLFYAMQRGLGQEEAVALIVNGFARDVLKELPMEFAVEAQKLLGVSLEGSVG